jgi:hypothetical protein
MFGAVGVQSAVLNLVQGQNYADIPFLPFQLNLSWAK